MPKFGNHSLTQYATLHPDLKKICDELIKTVDFEIVCGTRNEADQNAAFNAGLSHQKFPNGLHNKNPSLAMDLAPCPINWADDSEFLEFAPKVKAAAKSLDIALEWGGDWNGWKDIDHFQLVQK